MSATCATGARLAGVVAGLVAWSTAAAQASPPRGPDSLPVAQVEAVGRAFRERLIARDAAGAAALVNGSALREEMRQLVRGLGRASLAPPPRPTLAQRRQADPGMTDQELQLADRLDSLRLSRLASRRTVFVWSVQFPADSIEAMPPSEAVRRILQARLDQEVTNASRCPPGLQAWSAGVPDPFPVQGAVMLEPGVGLLLLEPSHMSNSAFLPRFDVAPEVVRVERDSVGWRLAWGGELRTRLSTSRTQFCDWLPSSRAATLSSSPADADSAMAVAAEYFRRIGEEDWMAAARLLEPRAIRATLDAAMAMASSSEAYPSAPPPTAEALLALDSTRTRADAELQAGRLRQIARQYRGPEFPELSGRSSSELRTLSEEEGAIALLRGRDPRTRYEALNRRGACPDGMEVPRGSWLPVRLLGAVRSHDSTFIVPYVVDRLRGRPIPRVMGVDGLVADEPIPVVFALRTPAGWRIRHVSWSDWTVQGEPDCVPVRR